MITSVADWRQGRRVMKWASWLAAIARISPDALRKGDVEAIKAMLKRSGSLDDELSARDKTENFVVECDLFPDRIFVPARDNDGNIQKDSDGTPVILDRDFVMAQRAWNQTHQATTKIVGEGKGTRTVDVPAVPFQCRLVPLSIAIARISPDAMRKDDADAIKAMLKRHDSWGAKLSVHAKDLLIALSVTRSRKGPLEQMLAEDFFKDLPNKGDIALIEHLAERFEGRKQADGSFSDTDFDSIVAFIDDWLGAELTWWSRIQRSCTRIWRNRGSISKGTSRALKVAFYSLIAVTVAVVLLFVSSIAAMIYGITADLTQPILGYTDPRWPAAALVFIGAWVVTILLFLLRPLQGILNPLVHKILGTGENWLTAFGYKFTLLIAPFGFLIPLAILTGASMYARFLIVGIPLLAIGSGMAFKAADVPAMARVLTIRGAKYGWIGGLIIIAGDWLVRNIPWMMVVDARKPVWAYVANNQILSSALLLATALVLGHLLIVRPIERTKYRSGNTLYIDKNTSWFARLAVIAIALAIAAMPWIKTEKHEIDLADLFAPKPAQAPSPTPLLISLPSDGHQHSGKLDCSALSPEGREAVGCK